MKPVKFITLLIASGFLLLSVNVLNAQDGKGNSEKNSKEIVRALMSNDESAQQSAMQQIINNPECVEGKNAVLKVLSIFRDSKKPAIRQLALITLYKMKDPWVMDFLRRGLAYENNMKIKSLTYACVADYLLTDETAYWKNFSKELVNAVKSNDPELQQHAMQLIIHYASKVNVKPALYDVLRVFRESDNQNFRKLALITLNTIQDKRTMDFLYRNLQYEKDESVKRLTCNCLHKYFDDNGIQHEFSTEPIKLTLK